MASRSRPDELPILGWKEQVSLPDWDVPRLRAKLDTGARTSALHVETYEVLPGTGGEGARVRFELLLGSRSEPRRRQLATRLLGTKVVRDTGARPEERPVVRTRIVCGPVDTEAEITLTSRRGMNFRMLLGRLTLQGRCVVDPARGYLVTPTPPRRSRP